MQEKVNQIVFDDENDYFKAFGKICDDPELNKYLVNNLALKIENCMLDHERRVAKLEHDYDSIF